MADSTWLAERFEETRGHLRAVAFRMLGSSTEADDAVQEAWLRLSRTDVSGVENLAGWLTTVVARVSLDMLRSRKARREEPLETDASEAFVEGDDEHDAEHGLLMADAVGLALLLVLETLGPAERVAFVLHDMFDLSFDEIAPIVGRSPAAARQLASRARRRVHGATTPDADRARQREVVDAFLAASRAGDFSALLALLDPDVVLRADRAAVEASLARQVAGAPALAAEVRGASTVAEAFSGRARAAQLALVNGVPGAVFAPGGQPRAAFTFTMANGRISAIEIVADAGHLRELEVVIINE